MGPVLIGARTCTHPIALLANQKYLPSPPTCADMTSRIILLNDDDDCVTTSDFRLTCRIPLFFQHFSSILPESATFSFSTHTHPVWPSGPETLGFGCQYATVASEPGLIACRVPTTISTFGAAATCCTRYSVVLDVPYVDPPICPFPDTRSDHVGRKYQHRQQTTPCALPFPPPTACGPSCWDAREPVTAAPPTPLSRSLCLRSLLRKPESERKRQDRWRQRPTYISTYFILFC